MSLMYHDKVKAAAATIGPEPQWMELAQVMVQAAEDTVGRGQESLRNLHERESVEDRERLIKSWEKVRQAQGTPEEAAARESHKQAKKEEDFPHNRTL